MFLVVMAILLRIYYRRSRDATSHMTGFIASVPVTKTTHKLKGIDSDLATITLF